MIWLLTIPFIIYFTFNDVITSNWLMIDGGMSHANFLEWAFVIITCLFISSILSLIPIGIAFYIGSIPKKHGVISKIYDLISLKEKDGIKGRFYLGMGTIEGIEYYFWYRKNKNGSISGGKTEREIGVEIYEETSAPKMIEFETKYTNKYVRYYLWIIGFDKTGDTNWCPRFIIPKGSIKEGYNL